MGKRISWDSQSPPPLCPEASKLKHQLLESYIEDWVVVLCSSHPRQTTTLTIVDGFCGGGLYSGKDDNEWLGSPFRIICAVKKGLDLVKTCKGKPDFTLNIQYIFIDNSKEHINYLETIFSEREILPNPSIKLIHGKFSNELAKILTLIKGRGGHAFFFLDPFGYTQFTMENIRSILEISGTEVLLTYMIDFIRRFLSDREGKKFNDTLQAKDYYLYINKYRSTNNPLAERMYLQKETLRLFRNQSKADYVFTLGLKYTIDMVKYYLIHIANNTKAQFVIKDSAWKYEIDTDDLAYSQALNFRIDNETQHLLFDLKEEYKEQGIQDLQKELVSHVRGSGSMPYSDLSSQTINNNPSTEDMYNKAIVGESLLQVTRDGKLTKASRIKSKDIIKINSQQYFHFYKNPIGPSSRFL